MEGIKVLDDNFVGQRTRPVHNLTIDDDTKFSNFHIPYTNVNNILYPVRFFFYYFQSNKEIFQAGYFNVNIRPYLLYFSIWGYTQKDTKTLLMAGE